MYILALPNEHKSTYEKMNWAIHTKQMEILTSTRNNILRLYIVAVFVSHPLISAASLKTTLGSDYSCFKNDESRADSCKNTKKG